MRIVRGVHGLIPLATLVRMEGRRPTSAEARTWVVDTEIVFIGDDRMFRTISHGFLTDLASAPWFVSWFVDPLSFEWIDASIIHDAGYAYLAPNRRTADLWFRQAARLNGASRFSAWAAWSALRLFGFASWRSNRRRRAKDGPRWRYLA